MTAKDLKNALLHEAVQGKLVPQIASEGNAKDLLEEIKKEKAKLIKEGKLKKEKPLHEITEEEISFDIPENWCWCRLGELCEIARGGSPRPIKDFLTTDENGYNWIKIGDTEKDGKYINHTEERIIKEGLKKTRLVHKGDFLLTNSMSFGRPYILNIDGCIHDGWLVISPQNNVFDKDFLYYILSSAFAYNQFCDSVSGAVVKNLNSDKVRDSLFPLPPLSEQKRIVVAIEQFMPLIEEYGKKEAELTALNADIAKTLKNAILQEAVQGKLAPQIASEGNAKDLLEEIKKEKVKLIKEGKLKKEKPLPEIIEEEIPFDIPKNWCWCRLGEIVSVLGDGIHGTPNYDIHGDYYFINGNNLSDGKIIIKQDTKKINEVEYQKYKKELNDNTVFVSINGTLGNIAFYNNEKIILGKSACFFNLIKNEMKSYIYWIIKTKYFFDYATQEATGTTIKNVSLATMKTFPVPMPPIAEQKRIVDVIEKILALCEKLRN